MSDGMDIVKTIEYLEANATPGHWGFKVEIAPWYGPTDESGWTARWEVCEEDLMNEDDPWCEPHLEGWIETSFEGSPREKHLHGDLTLITWARNNLARFAEVVGDRDRLLKSQNRSCELLTEIDALFGREDGYDLSEDLPGTIKAVIDERDALREAAERACADWTCNGGVCDVSHLQAALDRKPA